METEELCWKALRIGYERAFHKPASTAKVADLGYTVVLSTISWEDGAEKEEE
jgi:hypothetical protein